MLRIDLDPKDGMSLSDISSFDYDISKANIIYPSPPLLDNNHIRLVELVSPYLYTVFLKFLQTRLDEASPFSALSYTWGISSTNVDINGLRITDNLFAAMMNLGEKSPKLWWIDALCINQEDIHEKSKQVGIMRLIYEKAEKVCVWLGEPDIVTFELTKKIVRTLLKDEMPTQQFQYSNVVLEKLGLPPFNHQDWAALMRFLARSYFRRIWALQEITVAKLPIVAACGRLRLDWGLIELSTLWLRSNRLLGVCQSQLPVPARDRLYIGGQDITSMSLSLKDPQRSRSLEYLLDLSHDLNSTDPRDKVFALLGLASDEDESVAKVPIDYSQPVAEVYRDVTATIMSTRQSLKLLILKVDKSLQQIQDLPSWVPDYSVGFGRPKFRYAHFLRPSNPIDVQWHRDSNTLQIPGQFIDEVDVLGENATTYGSNTEGALLTWFETAAQSASADQWIWILSLADPEEAIDRNLNQFWRTMLGDFIDDQSPAPLEYKEHFAAAIFRAFLRRRISDHAWRLQFAVEVARALEEGQRDRDASPQIIHPSIAPLLQLAARENQKAPITPPDWRIPHTWLNFEKDGKGGLGPAGNRNAFIVQFCHAASQTRLFITKSGRMGRGLLSVTKGDQIVVVDGTDQLLILRDKPGGFEFIGECYVHGLMRGEGRGEGRETVNEYRRIVLL
ncbi:MAG: hypothetical protein Q9225_005133 [Loekoesia sp. 1 TL-2023]